MNAVEPDGFFVYYAPENKIGLDHFWINVGNGQRESLSVPVYVAVIPPTEKMYAIDGTSNHNNGSNVDIICNQLMNPAVEKCQYFAGPERIVDGGDSPKILREVERAIAKDLALAASMDLEMQIDLIGWSRGAVIAATVARNLQQPGVKSIDGRTFRSGVRFVGLFDAVNQMGANVTTPGGWATAFSSVPEAGRYHLIHTYHGLCLDAPVVHPFPGNDEDFYFPTVDTLTPTTPYYRPNPISGQQTQEASHSQVGRDPKSRDMMVTAARAAGVKIP